MKSKQDLFSSVFVCLCVRMCVWPVAQLWVCVYLFFSVCDKKEGDENKLRVTIITNKEPIIDKVDEEGNEINTQLLLC